jgi:putative ABC transport system permease protein
MIKANFKIAWRNLLKNKSHSLLNIGGLSIAMAATVLILLWVQNELRFDSYHKDIERIYLLGQYDKEDGKQEISEMSPWPAYDAIRAEVPGVELIAMANPSQWSEKVFKVNRRQFYEKNALYIDANWFKMFNYKLIDGSLEGIGKSADRIVVTRSKAEKYFGDVSAVNQIIRIDSIPLTVAAVIEDIPANSSIQQDIFIPNSMLLRDTKSLRSLNSWGFHSQMMFMKLSEKTSIASTERKITDTFNKNNKWNGDNINCLIPLQDLHFMQGLDGDITAAGNPKNIYIFSLLSALLLITASINFVNLSIARIGLRSREIGIRKIVGAAKKQLFSQIMSETALSVALSVLFTILFVNLSLPWFNDFTGKHFTFGLTEIHIAILIAGIFTIVLFLTGLYPAILLSIVKPVSLFRGESLIGMNKKNLSRVLVTAQLVLAVVMLIATITIYRQFNYIQQQADGYRKSQIFSFFTTDTGEPIHGDDEKAVNNRIQFLQTLKQELQTSAAVQAVSRVNGVSMVDDKDKESADITWTGYSAPKEEPEVVRLSVDEDYQKIAGLNVVSGRWFDIGNAGDAKNIILNETAVKTFGLREPVVGTTFSENASTGTIIGVIKDFHHKSLHEKIDPVIISQNVELGSSFLVKTSPGNAQKAIQHAQAVWNKRFPDNPLQYTFVDEEFDRLYKDDRNALSFTFVFAGLSILISCLGLLGMTMFAAQQRTKEIGIRKILGSSISGIVQLLSGDFMKLVLIAILIACPIAWWAMNIWLQDFAYRIELQWWMLALAGILTALLTFITIGAQAVKAALANPVKSLRAE